MTPIDDTIQRLEYGAIDIDFYIRKCHRERSLATYRNLEKCKQTAGEVASEFKNDTQKATTGLWGWMLSLLSSLSSTQPMQSR